MRQFSIRELLIAVAFVALALGWWIDRHNRPSQPARYQLTVMNGSAIMVDTATGEAWYQSSPSFSQPKIGK